MITTTTAAAMEVQAAATIALERAKSPAADNRSLVGAAWDRWAATYAQDHRATDKRRA